VTKDPIAEEQREEALLMDIIAHNNGFNNPVNEQDQQEADGYLNMSGDDIDAEDQPIAETSNNGQQLEL
jgi:hypothetical protein